jgi:hypothetical protein
MDKCFHLSSSILESNVPRDNLESNDQGDQVHYDTAMINLNLWEKSTTEIFNNVACNPLRCHCSEAGRSSLWPHNLCIKRNKRNKEMQIPEITSVEIKKH